MITGAVVNGHEIPEYAQCYCTARHIPAYAHPIPYYVPDGQILYLCPTTHHATSALYGLYERLGGQPPREICTKFNFVSQRLAKLCWRIEKEDEEARERLRREFAGQG